MKIQANFVKDGKWWVAWTEDVPGALTQGKTVDEARAPEIILREGKPAAVILDIDEYRGMLERLEDVEDLRMLKRMRKKKLQFRKLDDFLKEYHPGV